MPTYDETVANYPELERYLFAQSVREDIARIMAGEAW